LTLDGDGDGDGALDHRQGLLVIRDDALQELDGLPMVVLVEELEDQHGIDDRGALHRGAARDGVVTRPVRPGRAAGAFRSSFALPLGGEPTRRIDRARN